MGRITERFAALKKEGRAGLIIYISAGDPDLATSARIFESLPGAGADLIELGVPFTDPMADGPSVQAAGQRALKQGIKMRDVLAMVAQFRARDARTPVLLMGYYNLIYSYGPGKFCRDAAAAGVDGLITVDLPPEEAHELHPHAKASGIDLVMLAAPTTDAARLPAVLKYCSGFLYFVSVLGVTGTRSAAEGVVRAAYDRFRKLTDLPVGVGFGIKTPAQAAEVAKVAEAAVVGSAIVDRVRDNLDANGKAKPGLVESVLALVGELAAGVRGARR